MSRGLGDVYKRQVMAIIDPEEPELNQEYEGEVVSLAKYGAFINILPGRDGLMHISKFHSEIWVGDPEKVLTVGDKIQVVVDSIENGKVGLTPVNDIEIPEDALGDMDFKVAGTRGVITALQLDMKIEGLPSDILRKALEQAKDARHHILDIMEDTISEPADSLSGNAPRLESIELPKDKIGEVIGPKGKNIRKIEEETGASVEIDDDGILTLGSTEQESLDTAKEMVMAIIDPEEPELNQEYEGEVVSLANYGAFINILPGRDGLMHISKFHSEIRVGDPEKVLTVGDKIQVVVDSIENGKVGLTPVNDIEIPEDAIEKRQSGKKERKPRSSKPRENNDGNKKRKRVSFEDEFEKGI